MIDGHTLSVWVDIDRPLDEVRKAFLEYAAPFSGLPTQPAKSVEYFDQPDRPQPRLDRHRGKGMTVSVGRRREGVRCTALGHTPIRGAAGASVLNAELIYMKKYL